MERIKDVELIKKLFSDASDTEFKLAQDLVAIAMADGAISEQERRVIINICQQEEIAKESINDFMQGYDDDIHRLMPEERKDRMAYLENLIRVMAADGVCTHIEIYLLEIIASKMGVNYMELVSMVLMTATRRFFAGDTGSRALASFLHNVIDPKGKSLCTNCENIRTLFDLIARNVPQHQDLEENKATFVQAMDAASKMLMENSLLCDEFRSMGIDFETVLMDEQKQAIRRWIHR